MNSVQTLELVESKLISLIQEHYSQSGMGISLAELFYQCRRIKESEIIGDYIILHHILRRTQEILPSHKWNTSHLVRAVRDSKEINEFFSKRELKKHFKDYIK